MASAAAFAPAFLDHHVAQFAGETVVAVHHVAADDDTAAHARAEGDDDKVFHAFGRAEEHLAHCGGIGIVGQYGRHAEFFLHQGNDAGNALPGKIDRKFDTAIEIVSVRSAHANADEFEIFRTILQGVGYLPMQIVEIVFEILARRSGRDGRFAIDFPFLVYKTVLGVRPADIDAQGNFFHNLFFVFYFGKSLSAIRRTLRQI